MDLYVTRGRGGSASPSVFWCVAGKEKNSSIQIMRMYTRAKIQGVTQFYPLSQKYPQAAVY